MLVYQIQIWLLLGCHQAHGLQKVGESGSFPSRLLVSANSSHHANAHAVPIQFAPLSRQTYEQVEAELSKDMVDIQMLLRRSEQFMGNHRSSANQTAPLSASFSAAATSFNAAALPRRQPEMPPATVEQFLSHTPYWAAVSKKPGDSALHEVAARINNDLSEINSLLHLPTPDLGQGSGASSVASSVSGAPAPLVKSPFQVVAPKPSTSEKREGKDIVNVGKTGKTTIDVSQAEDMEGHLHAEDMHAEELSLMKRRQQVAQAESSATVAFTVGGATGILGASLAGSMSSLAANMKWMKNRSNGSIDQLELQAMEASLIYAAATKQELNKRMGKTEQPEASEDEDFDQVGTGGFKPDSKSSKSKEDEEEAADPLTAAVIAGGVAAVILAILTVCILYSILGGGGGSKAKSSGKQKSGWVMTVLWWIFLPFIIIYWIFGRCCGGMTLDDEAVRPDGLDELHEVWVMNDHTKPKP